MSRLRIVADHNIPFVEGAFAELGEVQLVPAGAIDAALVRDADLLLTRSTVKLGAPLLDKSRVRFVATATIGTDHLDLPWLAERGITWASAPGSNASSVAQWFASALLTMAARRGETLLGRTVGIVGVGNVGKRVESVALALGCKVLRNDPPRARVEGDAGFVSLDELCAASDILTIHVPLENNGPDRTHHLFGADRLRTLREGAWLVNASRGPVVDGNALLASRAEQNPAVLILDVFEGEPAVSPALVSAADLATPHIAGHSLDGKAAGTDAVYRAACAFLGARPTWKSRRSLPPQHAAAIVLDARGTDADIADEAAALALCRRFYRIESDDEALRRITTLSDALPDALPDDARAAFQRYRDQYPIRREPNGVLISTIPPRPRALALMHALGATIEPANEPGGDEKITTRD